METELRVIQLGGLISNAWLLPESSIGPILIDTGHPLSWSSLKRGLRQSGLSPELLKAVVLTHRHSDHAGNAARLQRGYGIPLYAHPRDCEILNEERRRPVMGPESRGIVRLMCVMENRFPARSCQAQPLREGEAFAGFEIYWVPGHTEGSICLYHRESRTLFSGDALLNAVPPLAIEKRLTLPFADYCFDYRLALQSLKDFMGLGLEVRRLCTGHGPIVEGFSWEQVEALFRESDGG